jgi:hypothetical protein
MCTFHVLDLVLIKDLENVNSNANKTWHENTQKILTRLFSPLYSTVLTGSMFIA